MATKHPDIDRFTAAVEATMEREGKTRSQATSIVVKSRPALHARYLAAFNEGAGHVARAQELRRQAATLPEFA